MIRIFSSCKKNWALIDAQLESQFATSTVDLRAEINGKIHGEIIQLPVLPNGFIHEIIAIPQGNISFKFHVKNTGIISPVKFNLRHIGQFERTWRMANRVFDFFIRIPREQRIEAGLTWWKALTDLPEAYRTTTTFRRILNYTEWRFKFDQLSKNDHHCIIDRSLKLSSGPKFTIILINDTTEKTNLSTSLSALKGQIYSNYNHIVINQTDNEFTSISKLNTLEKTYITPHVSISQELTIINKSLLNCPEKNWILIIRAGDILAPHALYWVATEILNNKSALVFYTDDDKLRINGDHYAPRFKPTWSITHFRSFNYIGNAAFFRADAVQTAGGINFSDLQHGNYDLFLRIADSVKTNSNCSIVHVPAILFHQQYLDTSKNTTWDSQEWHYIALQNHLHRTNISAEICSTSLPEIFRLRFEIPSPPPLVSIIIPTRDALLLLKKCLDSLLDKTTYPHVEILVIDNRSRDPLALAYLNSLNGRTNSKISIKILTYNKKFNYSAINNFAAGMAKGEILCLLNNDTEVISPNWLEEMVGHLLQPGVGAVGAKLYYPDGRVQHAGDVVGPGGCANHLHSFIERTDPGYCYRAAVAQELSAVTAACLITRRDIYLALGGLDSRFLKIAFNDVDYCLRLRNAGYKVIWTPHAELYHHESVSRGKNNTWSKFIQAEMEVAVMRKRWKHVMQNDPFYNPNLSYIRPDFSMSHVRRVKRPWIDTESPRNQ